MTTTTDQQASAMDGSWRPRRRLAAVTGTPIAYPATSARPGWLNLPRPVRAEIDRRSAQPVVDAIPARAGLTPTFASALTHADGSRSFCKAAPIASPAADAYAREAAIVAMLPPAVPAARLLWCSRHAGWFIAAYDLVDGSAPGPGWTAGRATAIVAAVDQAAAALVHASPALRAAARRPQPLPAGWADVDTGRRPLPPAAADLGALAASMSRWEHEFLTTAQHTPQVAHLDVRPDNLIVRPDGRIRLIDWATLQPAPAYVDMVMLAVAAADDGADPQQLFDQAAPAVTGDELDHALAWLSGAWLTYAAGAARPDAPHLRAHQLRSGLHTWQWLAARHDLPTAPNIPIPAPTSAVRRKPAA